MRKENSIITTARKFISEKKYKKALSCYAFFQNFYTDIADIVKVNKKILEKKIWEHDEFQQFVMEVPIFDNEDYTIEQFWKVIEGSPVDVKIDIIQGPAERSYLLAWFTLNDFGEGGGTIADTSVRMKRFLEQTEFFDAQFYEKQYKPILGGKDALTHFVQQGFAEGKLPARWFDLHVGTDQKVSRILEEAKQKSALPDVQPKVSVLVPVYNNAQYLHECIDSILNQSLKDIEIIIINDGSTDKNAVNILNSYARNDHRIRLIHKKNTGYGHSMNCGLLSASGKYVAIVESDDFIKGNAIKDLHLFAEKYQIDFVKSDYEEFEHKDGRNQIKKYENVIQKEYYGKMLNPIKDQGVLRIQGGGTRIWTSLYNLDFLRSNKIYFLETPGASYQDTGFLIKVMVSTQNFYVINKSYYMYRVDNINASMFQNTKLEPICNEYKVIYDYIKGDKYREKNFMSLYYFRKYRSYMWNYSRAAEGLKYNFYLRFGKEFYEDYKNRNLNLELFNDKDKNELFKSIKYYEHTQIKDKKFVFIYTSHLQGGGLEKVACILSTALEQLGFDVYFLLVSPEKISYKYSGVIYKRALSPQIKTLLEYAEYIFDFKFKSVNEDDEVIKYCVKNYAAKYISTIHNTKSCRNYFEKVYQYLNGQTLSSLFAIICVSNSVKNKFKSIYGNSNNLYTIYNPVVLNQSDKNYFLEYGEYILFAGRLSATEHKGIDILIDGYLKSEAPRNNVKLILAGDGALENRILEKINSSEYKNKIYCIGFRSDIHNIMKYAKFTVAPSRWEGFSLTIIESLSCGTPVISALVGGAGEVIENGKNGYLFESENVSSFINNINKMLIGSKKMHNYCLKSSLKFSLSEYKHNISSILKLKCVEITNTVNIAYIADDNYIVPTVVSLISLVKNTNGNTHYNIFILHHSLKFDVQKIFLNYQSTNIKINLIDIADILKLINVKKDVTKKNVTKTALVKFFLCDILENVDKVLYIDSDTLILSDLKDLYSSDIESYYCGAVRDIPWVLHGKKKINHIKFSYDYFNSGVLLLNLKKMRSDLISSKLLKTKYALDTGLMDQDAFNYVFFDKVKFLPLNYNLIIDAIYRHILNGNISIDDLNRKIGSRYTSFDDMISTASIIHFGSFYKPWKFYDMLYSDLWYYFYMKSPFSSDIIYRTSRLEEYLKNKAQKNN